MLATVSSLVVVATLAAWKLLRFLDDVFGIDTIPKVVRGVAVLLAFAALVFPDEFAAATTAFIPDLIAESTANLQWFFQPIVDSFAAANVG